MCTVLCAVTSMQIDTIRNIWLMVANVYRIHKFKPQELQKQNEIEINQLIGAGTNEHISCIFGQIDG